MNHRKITFRVIITLLVSSSFLIQCSSMGFLGEMIHPPIVKYVTLVVIVQDKESGALISDQQIPIGVQCDGTNFEYKEQVYSGMTRNGQIEFDSPPNRDFVVNAFETQKYGVGRVEVNRADLPNSGPLTVNLKLERLVTVLEGRVYNEENNYPVKEARISISDAGNNTLTDSNGNFSLRVPNYNPQITYSLSITCDKYSPLEKPISIINKNKNNFLGTFSLKPLGEIEFIEIEETDSITPPPPKPPKN